MALDLIEANSIIKEFPTDGHSPLLVIGSDYELYIAKNDKGKEPPYSLINECIAYFCFNNWNISCPNIKLINIVNELLINQDNLSNNHKLHYYNIPCFGSKYIKNSIDINALIVTKKIKAYNKLNNPLELFHITLFDTWVENDDRKPSNYNLILAPFENKFNIIPIDNAFIFSTLSYKYLNSDFVSVSVNDHLLVSDLGRLIKKNTTIDEDFINKQKEYFYLCIEKCNRNFDNFINQITDYYSIDPFSISNLKKFLFDEERNKKVFEEYIFRLNQ